VLHVLDRLGDVRILHGDRVRLFRHEVDPFEIAVVEAASLYFRHDEAGIVEVRARKSAFPDPASVEIDMDALRILKAAVEDVDVAEGTEIHVDARKIAAVEGGRVEKTESKGGSREHNVGKGGSSKAAAYETYAGKVDIHEGYVAKIYVYGVLPRRDRLDEKPGGILGSGMVGAAKEASRVGRSRASGHGTRHAAVHWLRLHHSRSRGKSGPLYP